MQRCWQTKVKLSLTKKFAEAIQRQEEIDHLNKKIEEQQYVRALCHNPEFDFSPEERKADSRAQAKRDNMLGEADTFEVEIPLAPKAEEKKRCCIQCAVAWQSLKAEKDVDNFHTPKNL